MKSCFFTASLLLAVLATPAWAETPLDLAEAEARALDRDPGLARFQALAEAEREASVAAGALPDPELSLRLNNLPVDSLDPADDPMSSVSLGLRQRFPAGDSRRLSRERGELAAGVREAEQAAREQELRRQLRRAWVAWAYSGRQLALVRETAADFDELVETTRSRYRTGMGSQRDLSRARLERAAVEERLLELQARHEVARAELVRWTGPLWDDAVPGEASLPAADDYELLREALHGHPLLQAEERRLSVSEKSVAIARQSYRPQWMIEAGYGHRRGEDMNGDRASDMLSVGVGLSLPLFAGNRQDRQVAAARAEARADHFQRMDLFHALQGQLETEWARHQRREELVALYEQRLLGEADEALELELAAYRADRGDFRELIRARVDELEYRLRLLQARQKLTESRIELAYLAGEKS